MIEAARADGAAGAGVESGFGFGEPDEFGRDALGDEGGAEDGKQRGGATRRGGGAGAGEEEIVVREEIFDFRFSIFDWGGGFSRERSGLGFGGGGRGGRGGLRRDDLFGGFEFVETGGEPIGVVCVVGEKLECGQRGAGLWRVVGERVEVVALERLLEAGGEFVPLLF